MFKLMPPPGTTGRGHRLTEHARSPWVIGEGDRARFVERLASSGATWQRITHKLGWFKKFHFLLSTPAEMVLVESFLRDAHRTLGAGKLVIGLPSRDAVIAADHAHRDRLMAVAMQRYRDVEEAERLSPDLFVVENGSIVGIAITLLDQPQPETTEVRRVLRVGEHGEFHITAGRDPDSLLELVDTFVSFAVEKWAPDPQFSGDCVLFVSAPETMQPTIDELASALAATTEASGCADRVRFRIEHTPY